MKAISYISLGKALQVPPAEFLLLFFLKIRSNYSTRHDGKADRSEHCFSLAIFTLFNFLCVTQVDEIECLFKEMRESQNHRTVKPYSCL